MKQHISPSVIRISKEQGYKGMKIILAGIEQERTDKFNDFETIEITKEELRSIGEHRWLIKEKE